jgi:hemolysin activation/secretion protein
VSSKYYALTMGPMDRETDLALSLGDAPRINGYVRVDNAGSRSTGVGRVIENLGINSLSGVGDYAGITALESRGLLYGKFTYVRPIGANGWRFGGEASTLTYRLGKEFSPLNLKGLAYTVGLNIRYPIVRSRMANLYFAAKVQHKIYENEAQGIVTSHFTVDVPELSLYGNYDDTLWGAASTNLRLSAVRGRVDLSGSPNAAAVAASTRTNGVYSRENLEFSRLQSIGESTAAYVSFSGQYANSNLDSSEFMTLGGPDGVRAYPVSEGAGGSGGLLNVELRQQLPYSFTFIPFYDRGFILINRHNNFIGAPLLNRYTLQGAGISLRWEPKPTIGVNVTLARRIGQNPARQANGLDQDGSLHRYRLWADGTWHF